jgi:hypothetical protein
MWRRLARRSLPIFRRNILRPSSGSKNKLNKQQGEFFVYAFSGMLVCWTFSLTMKALTASYSIATTARNWDLTSVWRVGRAYRYPYLLGNIIFQRQVPLGNSLICRSSFEGATFRARRLLVCYTVAPFFRCYFYGMFRPYMIIIREMILRNCLTVLLFIIHCSKTWLKLVPISV